MHAKRLHIKLGGGGGFCGFRQAGMYTIDKTLFIQHVLDDPYVSLLIPRPRRFGKTFNITTLKDFLERPESPQRAAQIQSCFEGSKIWNEPSAREHFQRYPVLFFSFRACKAMHWEGAWSHIRAELINMLRKHRALLTTPGVLDHEQQRWYRTGLKGSLSSSDYARLLPILSEGLFRLHGAPVVILIDEYDTPIHSGLEHGYYSEAITFFKPFLTLGFKDNDFLFKGVLTGILRVSKENMFSDLNNVGVYSLLSDAYTTDFGLTQEDVIQVLEDQGCPELLPDIEKMYNGYLFGCFRPVAIYNPWSTLSCIANREHQLKPYWNGSGSPELLHTLVVKNGPLIHPELHRLLELETLSVTVTEHVNLTALEHSATDLFSFMLFTGYLKATEVIPVGDDWQVRLGLVNQELHAIFTKLYRTWLGRGHPTFSAEPLLSAVLGGDATWLQQQLERILLNNASFLDGAARKPENFYQGLMLGLLMLLKKEYEVISNLESGRGRADLLLLPRTPGQAGVTMELKVVKEGSFHAEALLAALTQIQAKRYTARLEERQARPIHAYAVAFDGKDVRVALESDRPELELERARLKEAREAQKRAASHPVVPVMPAPSSVPMLDMETRLALEDTVLPLLTPLSLGELWTRLAFPLSELPVQSQLLAWGELVSRCIYSGMLPTLARLLDRQLPELKGNPLMEKLREPTKTAP